MKVLNDKVTRVTASVSMHRKIYEKILELGREDNRTVSNMIAVLVKEAIDAREKAQGKVDEKVEA